jgi:hypothetical protein
MQGLGVEIPINLKVREKGEAIIGKIPNFSSFSKEWKKAGRRGLTVIFFPAENNFYYIKKTFTDNYWLGKTKPCLTYGLRYGRLIDKKLFNF